MTARVMAIEWSIRSWGGVGRGWRNIFGVRLRAGICTPTTHRHGDKFTTDPIRKGTTRGRLPSDTSEMMIECCVVGKRQTSRGCVAGKKCFVSLAEMRLNPVTFSPASHHSLLVFHSFWVHICLRDKGPFGLWLTVRAPWGSTFSPML